MRGKKAEARRPTTPSLIAKNVSLLCLYDTQRERERDIFAIYGRERKKGHYENRRPCVLYTRSVVRRVRGEHLRIFPTVIYE